MAPVAATLVECRSPSFVGNVCEHIYDTFVNFDSCLAAVEIANRDLDSPAAPRIIGSGGHTPFGLSREVVEPFGYALDPGTWATAPPGTLFWYSGSLRVVDLNDEPPPAPPRVVKRVEWDS
jgi:hypothetical protein